MKKTVKNLENKKRLTYQHLLDSPLSSKFSKIAKDINSTNPRQILYHWHQGNSKIPQCLCGSYLQWHPDKRIYRNYCSKSCSAKYSVAERKKNNLKTLGVEWHSQTVSWQEKVKKTSYKKYGASHYSKTINFKESYKKTSKEKYNVDHIMHLEDTKQKLKSSCQEKYGYDYPSQSPIIKDKIKKTNQKKYGTDSVLSNKHVRQKIKNTNLKKYGFENPAQNSNIREKITKSRKKNFYPPDTLHLLENREWLREQNSSGKTIAEIAHHLEISPSNLGKIYHNQGLEIVRHQHSLCENAIYNKFSSKYNITRNTRSVINPKEIDLYFIDQKLGIEVNGIYFHSEKFHREKTYHLEKTIEAKKKNITLLHFWDFEIKSKLEIVENIIQSNLGIINNKINARQTQVIEINKNDKKTFLEKYHLQGNAASTIDLGLIHNNSLVLVASFSLNRFSKNAKYELVRLCSKKDTTVRGGAGKILSYFSKNFMNNRDKLVSYADRRYSNGSVYQKIGFDFSHYSDPGFFYVNSSGIYAGSRHSWQKHLLEKKLKIFDPNLSANDNMRLNNYYRVWDCGQSVYIFTK